MKTMSHTPTPWKIVKHKSFNLFDSTETNTIAIELGNGSKIALLAGNQEANAAFIVTACNEYAENKRKANAHEDLMKALKIARNQLAEQGTRLNVIDEALAKAGVTL